MRFVSYATTHTKGAIVSYGLLLASGEVVDLPQAAALIDAAVPHSGLLTFIEAGEEMLSLAQRLFQSVVE